MMLQAGLTLPPEAEKEEDEEVISPHEIPVVGGALVRPQLLNVALPPHWKIARDRHNRLYFYHRFVETSFFEWFCAG